METLSQRLTPIMKCMVLFLLIFTAKVLTSRPNENQDTKNGIQSSKTTHYVRTFTKYHHRRTGHQEYWPTTENTKHNIEKRSADVLNSKELLDSLVKPSTLEFNQEYQSSNAIGDETKSSDNKSNSKNSVVVKQPKYQVKKAEIATAPPKVITPGIFCVYKTNFVVLTDTQTEDLDEQPMVENDTPDNEHRLLSMKKLPNGEVKEVEQCLEPSNTCYTLFNSTNGNITILGQGCWKSSGDGRTACNKCSRTGSLLQDTKFCCCNTDYCNDDFLSLEEEVVTPKAESTTYTKTPQTNYSNIVAAAILAAIAILVLTVAVNRMFCKRPDVDKDDMSDGLDVEKGDMKGNGPDGLATGLLCVDNLTLIEHIGRGKFGSVWRGTLGSLSVAVKLYSSPVAWKRESSIYEKPYLVHRNLLRYYGSDSRPTLTEGGNREYLIVVELCAMTLRQRLIEDTLTWHQFAHIAHGIASALAHLHSITPTKPCIVHRDVNSNNVLLTVNGDAKLADLSLAQIRHDCDTRISEAGTLRYLPPEALEGAVDLTGARCALCAVDVYALGLVMWEALSRCGDTAVPVYEPPYHSAGLTHCSTLAHTQTIVCVHKYRPPLPTVGPGVSEPRALRLAADTVADCWDHDAEARLTAFCVEERMSELKHMLSTPAPVIHDNNLHTHDTNTPPEPDKNSNCTAQNGQNCDVRTPLLYTQPHIGRNPCIQRNTHTTDTQPIQLIHKSLKDVTVHQHTEQPRVQNDEPVLSVARVNRNRGIVNENAQMNEIRSYQRPLEYVPNDVTSQDDVRALKETNLHQDVKIEKPKWGIKKFFQRRLNKNCKARETEVKLITDNLSNGLVQNAGRTRTSLVEKQSNVRPADLVLKDRGMYNYEAPCLSPPNRTLSPTMMLESDLNRENKVFGFKELPSQNDSEAKPAQIFAVIVPKAKPTDYNNSNIEIRKRGSTDSINKSLRTSMSSQIIKSSGNSESEDSTIKKRLSCDNRIMTASNSGRSSRASINLELQYLDNNQDLPESPFDMNSDCSSSEDEHLMLLSENGSKITMHTVPKNVEIDKRRQNEVLKESSQTKSTSIDFCFNKYQNQYTNFDNECSDPHDKENLVNTFSGDNPVYIAALKGEIDSDMMTQTSLDDNKSPKSPRPSLKSLTIKRQHSLEQVSDIFSSSSDMQLQNPAGRVKTPGDLPVAVRKARRDRVLKRGRSYDSNRLSLYDDRMMFVNSL